MGGKMKKVFLFVILAVIAVGAICMSYSSYWAFDALGAVAIIAGSIAGTIATVRHLKGRKRVAALIALYTAVVLLIVAGSVLFSGTILIAFMGAAALAVFGFLLGKE